jgi:glucose/arabinose dehydrogenase
MKVSEKFEVLETVQLEVGERIRDLELLSNGALIATTDSGKLLTVKNSA